MPWMETCAMSERLRFVKECVREDETMAALCARYGVSRETGYKWLDRFMKEGPGGLEDRSRARHHHPNATADRVELRVRHLSVLQIDEATFRFARKCELTRLSRNADELDDVW